MLWDSCTFACILLSNLDCYKNNLCSLSCRPKLQVEQEKQRQPQVANFSSSKDQILHELH